MDMDEGTTGSVHMDPIPENNNSDSQSETDEFLDHNSEQDDDCSMNADTDDAFECGYYKSNAGKEFWTPVCEDRFKPYANQYFASVEEGYQFYREYGRKCGFDVRKNTSRKDREGNLRYKYIVCSNAGSATKDSTSSSKSGIPENPTRQRRTASRRCCCCAKIILKYMGVRGYVVISFVEEHNHALMPEECRKFLRCSRQLSFGHKTFIADVGRANIGSKRAFSLLKELAGSYENIGATSTDYKNFSRDLKLRIGRHDSDMLIDKFKTKSDLSNNSFFYDYKVDANGRLTGLFWADAIGRRNYRLFGDALSFDPTFRTNRYCMVFIPFTGVDNHWNNVTFASALLEKEDFDNFKWLLEAFTRAMEQVPKVVITDQCPAISKALRTIWPDTPHRFCMWHIMNKLSAKIGPSLASDKKFMEKLKSVVWADHLCIEDFEEGWQDVLDEYKLKDNAWLGDMYRIRSEWIPAFFNNTPMGGLLRTTSRSESSNKFFQHFQKSGDTLIEFYSRYESAIDKQRYVYSENNKDSQFMPIIEKGIPLEKDAAKVYTRHLFNIVRQEIQSAFYHTQIKVRNTVGGTTFFEIIDRLIRNKEFKVQVTLPDIQVECSCKQFFRTGYLCKHAFAALHQCGVTHIPPEYVSRRWTKNSEKDAASMRTDEFLENCDSANRLKSKVNEMVFDFHACIRSVGMNAEKIDDMHSRVKQMKLDYSIGQDVQGVGQNIAEIDMLVGSQPKGPVSIQNPNISRNKGCGSRIKSGKETVMDAVKEKRRRCSKCQKIEGHNARNCPLDKK